MPKELMASCDENVKAAHTVALAAGQEDAADALAMGYAAGIPWQELLKAFVTMALPVFLKWVQDWLAGTKVPVPDAPKMP